MVELNSFRSELWSVVAGVRGRLAAEHIPEVRAAFAKKGVPVDVRIDCESLHHQVKSN